MEQGTFDFGGMAPAPPVKLCECECGEPAPLATRNDPRHGYVKGQPVRYIFGHRPGLKGPHEWARKLSIEAGQQIGHSVVIDADVMLPEPGGSKMSRAARLRCECGAEYVRRVVVIFWSPDTESCGCRSGRFADHAGQRYGRLVAIRRVDLRPDKPGMTARWLCVCDCGNEIIVFAASLTRKSRSTRSCGCLRKGPSKGRAFGEAAFNNLLNGYRHAAKRKGLAWDLTKDEFARLTKLACHYCGARPAAIMKPSHGRKASEASGVYVYNGVDRKDNAAGYVEGNVLPACGPCNHAKATMAYEDFLALAARIAARHPRPAQLDEAAA
jgi:hypothetical protein